jgi:hypothetical protein
MKYDSKIHCYDCLDEDENDLTIITKGKFKNKLFCSDCLEWRSIATKFVKLAKKVLN